MNKHNRTYTAMLIALTFMYCMAVLSLMFLSRSPTVQEDSRWVFEMSMWINAALVAVMVVTLVLRKVTPSAGRMATKALNFVLLIAVPFGTVVGIYGLLKVDKEAEPA